MTNSLKRRTWGRRSSLKALGVAGICTIMLMGGGGMFGMAQAAVKAPNASTKTVAVKAPHRPKP